MSMNGDENEHDQSVTCGDCVYGMPYPPDQGGPHLMKCTHPWVTRAIIFDDSAGCSLFKPRVRRLSVKLEGDDANEHLV